MAAHLYLHILEGVTEEELKIFFAGSNHKQWSTIYNQIADTPSVQIGELSWDDSCVYAIQELLTSSIHELNAALIQQIINILGIEEAKSAFAKEVQTFLNQHQGKKIFVISW